MQRCFIPGDQWLYFKIYTGIKTADLVLTDYVQPLAEELSDHGLINQWFFIRYSDPDFHLRFRIRLSSEGAAGSSLLTANRIFKYLIEANLIWKVQLDTYNREVERYGALTMEDSEAIFYRDSQMILKAIKIFDDSEDLNLKWIWALYAIDSFMGDIGFELQEKFDLIKRLKEGFAEEFAADTSAKKQLSRKYQTHKTDIASFLDRRCHAPQHLILYDLVEHKSEYTKDAISSINLKTDIENLSYLISSHLHMMINRLFRSKNRLNEFVCYEMLYFYYNSKIAQEKNLRKSYS
ncbi:MAG: hypothetical protein DI539_21430 [Flavobacterium psychrophilum]|nr:MAG: hypothetical protein DI539_21430 [Flavobacterium psychrophilum]